MFIKRVVTVGLMSAALGFASVAAAQTFDGTIDGEPRTWHILTEGGESTASVSQQGPGTLMVVIQGHAQDSYAIKGTITINAAMLDGQLLGAPDVVYFPEEKMRPNYSSVAQEPGEISVKFENSTKENVQVIGHYKGKLYRTAGIGEAPNMDDVVEVSVKFDVPAIKTMR